MNYILKAIFLLLFIPVNLFSQMEQVTDFTNDHEPTKTQTILVSDALNHIISYENLPIKFHAILIDELSKSVSIDSLNKLMFERAIWDTLNAMGVDVVNARNIIQFDIDFSIRESSYDTFIDVTIQVVYNSSDVAEQETNAFFRDRQSIVLSTTHQRLINSFTLKVDQSLLVVETEIQGDSDATETGELLEETEHRRRGIFLIVENGILQGYSYKDIEARAFENRRLTDMDLPDGIQTIGARAFANNRLAVINIPHTVTTIEAGAFVNNRAEIVSIGENVQLGRNAIGRGFESFYNRNGKKAGFYIYERGIWSWGYNVNTARVR